MFSAPVKLGYPPKPLADVPSNTVLSDPRLNIRKGDQLIVSSRTPPAGAPMAGGASTAAALPTASSGERAGSASSAAASARGQPVTATEASAAGERHRLVDGSYLVLKVVPDDNSCLFNAIGCIVKRQSDAATCNELRKGMSC